MIALCSSVPQTDHPKVGVGVILSSSVKDCGMYEPRFFLRLVEVLFGLVWVSLEYFWLQLILRSTSLLPGLEKFWDSVRQVLDMVDANEKVILLHL